MQMQQQQQHPRRMVKKTREKTIAERPTPNQQVFSLTSREEEEERNKRGHTPSHKTTQWSLRLPTSRWCGREIAKKQKMTTKKTGSLVSDSLSVP